MTVLPARLVEPMGRQLVQVQQLHDADLAAGGGWVALPDALARKYPNRGREWGWQWVFPETCVYVDGETRQRQRHHLHESVVQRAVKAAARQAGLAKPASRSGPCV